MKVALIKDYAEVFKEHLRITQDYNELYKYESLNNFQRNWDLGELDLGKMYDKSLESSLSARLWGGSQDSAKSLMLEFIETDKEYVRSMFRDLFNEDKDLSMRINRFKFHCDELLAQLQTKGRKLSHHHHGDEEICLYLAFNAPETYPLFHYAPFQIMMTRLENKAVPQEWEVDRYYKLCNGLYTLLTKDEDLKMLHHGQVGQYYEEKSRLIVNDFLLICSQKPRI